MLDNTLYRRTIDGLLLKCLGSNQSKIAMGEVHEGIYGTHQSAHKMKWLLYHAGFYWLTMLNYCLGTTMTVSRLGFRLRWPNSSCFI
jgi:hypothetical protein